jgi:hypothetical protein
MVMGDNKNEDEKMQKKSDIFDHHRDATVQSGVHCPMMHIKGFTRSCWMPALGKCLHRITPTAMRGASILVRLAQRSQ